VGDRERSGVTADRLEQREERFRDVYDSVRARVLAYAIRRTSSPEDAADIVAETFAIAWRRLDDVPTGDDRILWFYTTARRVLANHHRRVRRRDELVDRIGVELRCGLAHVDSVDTDRVALLAAFRRLGEADRELLMLAGWEGLDSAELARLLRCSRTAVRIRLHRARARLTREMTSLESGRETSGGSRTLTVTKATPEPDATSSFHAGRQKG
jgi:RNA polymerase sigma factor (sigma-70 family)